MYMGSNSIRLLRADEIECRTGIIRENGLSLLLYKDTRVDQNILDEVFGILGWKRLHQVIDGKMFCTISVRDENGEWIDKMDVGTESYSEAVKGAASDSFKRAAVNIGVGRELYTAPFIWLPSSVVRLEKRGDKWITKDSFHVAEIQYNEEIRAISGLRICNQNRLTVYEIGLERKGEYASQKKESKKKKEIQAKDSKENSGKSAKRTYKNAAIISEGQIQEIRKELARTGVAEFNVLQRFGVAALETMDEETFLRAMSALRKTPTAA